MQTRRYFYVPVAEREEKKRGLSRDAFVSAFGLLHCGCASRELFWSAVWGGLGRAAPWFASGDAVSVLLLCCRVWANFETPLGELLNAASCMRIYTCLYIHARAIHASTRLGARGFRHFSSEKECIRSDRAFCVFVWCFSFLVSFFMVRKSCF